MYASMDEVETVHLYVVRETPKQPYIVLPLLFGLLCLLGIAGVTLYSAQHPHYEHRQLSIPAIPLSVKTFTAEASIIPTGIKTYPATYATS
ncbi:MAG TPA: hypothetical protein VFQ30_18100, partial [Ktedonobacteraceae bacterium]|nr:hypothetical protein [Ktedonobacteraceae bacterium]